MANFKDEYETYTIYRQGNTYREYLCEIYGHDDVYDSFTRNILDSSVCHFSLETAKVKLQLLRNYSKRSSFGIAKLTIRYETEDVDIE